MRCSLDNHSQQVNMRFVGRAARAHDRVEPHREQRSPTDRAADEGAASAAPTSSIETYEARVGYPGRVQPRATPRSGGVGVACLTESGDATFAEFATRLLGRLPSRMVWAMSRSLRLLSWDILERLLNASSAS